MRYNFFFSVLPDPTLLAYLEEHEIKSKAAGRLLTFSIYSADRNPPSAVNDVIRICKGRNPIVYVEYSKAEIDSAEYLWLLPESQTIDICNSDEAYSYSCQSMQVGGRRSNHEEQIKAFRIAKEPKLGTKTAFWSPDTGFSEVFLDVRVAQIISKNDISGVNLREVYLKNGDLSKDIYQLSSSAILDSSAIARGYGEIIEICPQCGKEQICIDPSYQFHLLRNTVPVGIDLFSTTRCIGPGIGHPIYVISHRFYELLHNAQLIGKLGLAPIKLIS